MDLNVSSDKSINKNRQGLNLLRLLDCTLFTPMLILGLYIL